MSVSDVLLDIGLAEYVLEKYVPSARCVVDSAPFSFHGRWLVEMWLGGATWGSHCANRCLALLLCGLEGDATPFWGAMYLPSRKGKSGGPKHEAHQP